MARTVELDSNKLAWTPTGWPGISRKLLRSDPATGARASLLKREANALYSPPGSADDVFTETGAVLFVALPKPHVDLE